MVLGSVKSTFSIDAKGLVLCGFMSSGKSLLLGRLSELGPKLLKYIDLDTAIEKSQNMKISQIFDLHGQPFFRELEANLLDEFTQQENIVIALGGGALTERSLDLIRERKFVLIYVKRPFDDCIDSAKKQTDVSRPLLDLSREELLKLYQKREQLYLKSDFVIKSSDILKINNFNDLTQFLVSL